MKNKIQLIKYLVIASIILTFVFLSTNERRKYLTIQENNIALRRSIITLSNPNELNKIIEEYKEFVDTLKREVYEKDSIIAALTK
ncbi:MAG: hypothetical protein EHM93_07330 [Bacteroidales bacterium]|nr:MAG: hypothetical protein EHM93_07330 [Bacteroidales bacterium]